MEGSRDKELSSSIESSLQNDIPLSVRQAIETIVEERRNSRYTYHSDMDDSDGFFEKKQEFVENMEVNVEEKKESVEELHARASERLQQHLSNIRSSYNLNQTVRPRTSIFDIVQKWALQRTHSPASEHDNAHHSSEQPVVVYDVEQGGWRRPAEDMAATGNQSQMLRTSYSRDNDSNDRNDINPLDQLFEDDQLFSGRGWTRQSVGMLFEWYDQALRASEDHWKAARRCAMKDTVLMIPMIGFAAASAILSAIITGNNNCSETKPEVIALNVCTAISAVTASLSSQLDYASRKEQHTATARSYNNIAHIIQGELFMPAERKRDVEVVIRTVSDAFDSTASHAPIQYAF